MESEPYFAHDLIFWHLFLYFQPFFVFEGKLTVLSRGSVSLQGPYRTVWGSLPARGSSLVGLSTQAEVTATAPGCRSVKVMGPLSRYGRRQESPPAVGLAGGGGGSGCHGSEASKTVRRPSSVLPQRRPRRGEEGASCLHVRASASGGVMVAGGVVPNDGYRRAAERPTWSCKRSVGNSLPLAACSLAALAFLSNPSVAFQVRLTRHSLALVLAKASPVLSLRRAVEARENTTLQKVLFSFLPLEALQPIMVGSPPLLASCVYTCLC